MVKIKVTYPHTDLERKLLGTKPQPNNAEILSASVKPSDRSDNIPFDQYVKNPK